MEGISPGKYANAELMKIPNFLHLTPAHVKKHCEALKRMNFLMRCLHQVIITVFFPHRRVLQI